MKELEFTTYSQLHSKNPKTLVAMIHGYGSNSKDLITLAPDAAPHIEDAIFISPNAPFNYESGASGCYQWYSLMDRSPRAMLDGFNKAKPILHNFLVNQLDKYNLTFANLILMGFSQGGMMTLHYGLQSDRQLKGLASFSGYLVADSEFDKRVVTKPPVLITHGDMDSVVPYSAYLATLQKLKSLNLNITNYSGNGLGHGIDEGCIKIAQNFLRSL